MFESRKRLQEKVECLEERLYERRNLEREYEEREADYRRSCRAEIADLRREGDARIAELVQQHRLDLTEKEFESNNAVAVATTKIFKENTELKQELAVAKQLIKSLEEMVDVNADIIDIKALTNKLIEKLPEINLKSLTVQATK